MIRNPEGVQLFAWTFRLIDFSYLRKYDSTKTSTRTPYWNSILKHMIGRDNHSVVSVKRITMESCNCQAEEILEIMPPLRGSGFRTHWVYNNTTPSGLEKIRLVRRAQAIAPAIDRWGPPYTLCQSLSWFEEPQYLIVDILILWVLSKENNPGIGYIGKGNKRIRLLIFSFEIFPHCGHV